MLSIEGLTKRFRGGGYGVRDLSMSANAGVVGLLGPNGAGKTTLMHMLATVTRPTRGRILFRGVDVAVRPEDIRPKVGYLPQEFGAYENLTAFEFVGYIGALKGVREAGRVREMLRRVGLHGVADRPIGGFSGGMKRRVGIAQAMINEPELLLVDEPTAGLDPEERLRLREMLSDLGHRSLIILSTHIVSDVESLATRIAVLGKGRLLAYASPGEVRRDAVGHVWDVTMSASEFHGRRQELAVSTVVRRGDAVELRVISPERPDPEAQLSTPTLEDAFVYLIHRAETISAKDMP